MDAPSQSESTGEPVMAKQIGDVEQQKETPTLSVVVFSKDRPFQLLNCLSSLARHVLGVALQVFVLYRWSSQRFAESYEVVEKLIQGTFAHRASKSGRACEAVWLLETEADVLGILLDKVLDSAKTRSSTPMVLFTVDDALWFDDLYADAAIRLLLSDEQVFTVHAKLCPRCEFAHPNSKFMRLPSLRMRFDTQLGKDAPPLLVFEREQGEYDWNYPWELSGSIYRAADVCELLEALRKNFDESAVNHPNHLEGSGVRLIKQQKVATASRRHLSACCSRPVMAVVTINRVQTIFDNPVYSVQEGQGDSESDLALEASPEALDDAFRSALTLAFGKEKLDDCPRYAELEELLPSQEWLAKCLPTAGGKQAQGSYEDDFLSKLLQPPIAIPGLFDHHSSLGPLSTDAYQLSYFDTVHVPLVTEVQKAEAALLQDGKAAVRVSWLMPVRNVPKAWLEEALESIRGQEGMCPGSWELIVVDDGSDLRETQELLELWEQKEPHVKVIRLQQSQGVAGALNAGWSHCSGEYIARLDGDDVAHPLRLQRQLAFLEAHPSIGVLGGAFTTFNKSEALHSQTEGLQGARWYRMSCHPLLVRWQMLFSCSLAHPTVTFRRAALKDSSAGPYPLEEDAEDHCCWLALPLSVKMANTGDLVTYIRRHPGSRTATSAAAIRQSSYRAVARFLAQHCSSSDGTPISLREVDVAVLWGAADVQSAEQAQHVSAALTAMESLFSQMISQHDDPDKSKLETSAAGKSFAKDFLIARQGALQEYITSSCSKLRGALAVQALAAGDLSSGTEMVRSWLNTGAGSGGGAGLKSLGALISAGFSSQQLR